MNLETVAIDYNEARTKVAEYLGAVRERHHAEDDLILKGYRQILRGNRVISLPDVFRKGGLHRDGTPRLGIVRADAERCFMLRYTDGDVRFGATNSQARWGDGGKKAGRVVVKDVCPKRDHAIGVQMYETIAPIVPPGLRPARGIELYHVLFEVEEWKPFPPVDPALLRHIGGDLWAVISTWNLTPLERLVIAGR